MAAASRRSVAVIYSGDVEGDNTIPAEANASSPASIQLVELLPVGTYDDVPFDGYTEITVPDGATAVTIQKPGDNANSLVLAATDGASGIELHDTDPDSLSLGSVASFFIYNGGATAVTLRLFWS